jgi:hypothetical protein
MSALAETLVDEWLNCQGFFTIRGMKDGVGEIDLLGDRPLAAGMEAWHVEVQASFRPIGYISKLTKELSQSLGKVRTSSWGREADLLEQCVGAWVRTEFTERSKALARERAWPGVQWQFSGSYVLVGGETVSV